MIKLKKGSLFFLQMLKENLSVLLLYALMVGLFASTFFLYDIPTAVYQDALWFTLPLLVLFLGYRGWTLWRKHRQLQQLIQREWLNLLETPYRTNALLERDYQRLLAKLDQQVQQVITNQERQETELLDYYSLWTHQIKTPLAALDLLIQSSDAHEKKAMKDEIFKIQEYLNMMLQYLRLQSIHQDFRFETLNIEVLVKAVIKKYRSFFIYKDLAVTIDLPNSSVISDQKWLSFILEQIIFNAIKYTQEGAITIYAAADNPQHILIRDTGRGIRQEDLPRVFERGYTGYSGRDNHQASGLGLFMSKEIAEQLGIQLTISSELNQGTEVSLDFSQQLSDTTKTYF